MHYHRWLFFIISCILFSATFYCIVISINLCYISSNIVLNRFYGIMNCQPWLILSNIYFILISVNFYYINSNIKLNNALSAMIIFYEYFSDLKFSYFYYTSSNRNLNWYYGIMHCQPRLIFSNISYILISFNFSINCY